MMLNAACWGGTFIAAKASIDSLKAAGVPNAGASVGFLRFALATLPLLSWLHRSSCRESAAMSLVVGAVWGMSYACTFISYTLGTTGASVVLKSRWNVVSMRFFFCLRPFKTCCFCSFFEPPEKCVPLCLISFLFLWMEKKSTSTSYTLDITEANVFAQYDMSPLSSHFRPFYLTVCYFSVYHVFPPLGRPPQELKPPSSLPFNRWWSQHARHVLHANSSVAP